MTLFTFEINKMLMILTHMIISSKSSGQADRGQLFPIIKKTTQYFDSTLKRKSVCNHFKMLTPLYNRFVKFSCMIFL